MTALLLGVGAPVQVIAGWVSPKDRPWWLVGAAACAGLGAMLSLLPDHQPNKSTPDLLLPRVNEATPAEQMEIRRALLTQVRRTWIEGLLDRSLAEVVRVELGLAERPQAVAHPWGALLGAPNQPAQPVRVEIDIGEAFTRFDGRLLILGGPGAGKTTLLLEHTRELLERAERETEAPIPAVFHLSSWPAEQSSLAIWLIEELSLRYGVSRRWAAELVEHDRLAVLLDGLDEVALDRRRVCVQAINAFRADHGLVPMVVCARSREYEELGDELLLSLNGAVEAQPLDRTQVRGWLQSAGRQLAGLRSALRDSRHWLWGLLDSPLLLSIAALTYRGQPSRLIRADGSMDVLFGAYVEAMLARPRAALAPQEEQYVYSRDETLQTLTWLAGKMGSESMFFPDWIQPDWLSTRRQQWLVTTGLGIVTAVVVGLVVGSMVGLAFAVGADDPGLGRYFGLSAGVVFGLGAGVIAGLSPRGSRIEPVERLRWSWKRARTVGLRGGRVIGIVFFCLFAGIFLVETDWESEVAYQIGYGLVTAIIAAVLTGVIGGVVFGVGGGFTARPNLRPQTPGEGMRTARRVAWRAAWSAVAVAGLSLAILIGLLGWLNNRTGGMTRGVGYAVTFALAAGLLSWIQHGGAAYVRHKLVCMLLRRDRTIPSDLVALLDYADERILLRRVGGGYLFAHRLLQDYFLGQYR